ncbi:cytochrome c oxidase assembly factor 4 homolog, mitochondrial [Diorhabda carinulata]|uniref:cytochrome c oxidase assembly factor 4 homolog, mitochondrial n=1 Tax=Diorhabda sublineata TaxID=1163346 RepID=UPI0024E0933A|nr:cytochrome c oxidase assembly factor 4 homolog, mitochondrial [Diorhabda sublineata]XP_057660754.1 cytochrome c oxidase assembly factor 4 homolog, mitochondrial [Diorhabda carinulata]
MEDCEPCKRKEMASNHGNQEISDPVEDMLIKTGCINLHYKVQDCYSETKDWRKCQLEVNEFRKCMEKHQQSRLKGIQRT